MSWTIRWFLYSRNLWEAQAQAQVVQPGFTSYATRQQALWYRMAEQAYNIFKGKVVLDHALESAFCIKN
jgi:hypothetical protein